MLCMDHLILYSWMNGSTILYQAQYIHVWNTIQLTAYKLIMCKIMEIPDFHSNTFQFQLEQTIWLALIINPIRV